jgi:hypothetical protein
MGILDDVTHAGDQPEITVPSNPESPVVFFTVTEDNILSLKEWLASATDEQKEIVTDANVTTVSYSHPKFMAKSILIGFREELAELFETEFTSLPKVKKYQTISYSNSEPFTYTNDVVLDSEIIDDNDKQYKIYIVLDGSLKTTTVAYRTFSANEAYCVITAPCTEEISNAGEEDSLILCLTLA